MNPSRPFIERPVATTLLMTAILLCGLAAFRLLPLSALPEVDYPTIQVVTFYPGAGPDVMTAAVTSPLERQFGQMPGLKQMFSTSSAGASVITLEFALEMSLDVAEQEVQAAINSASNVLPTDLPVPPVYNKVNPADTPILTLALTSKTLPLTRVQNLADTRLAQKISQISGVGLVTLSGGQRPAVRIKANPSALAAYGMSMEDLRTAVAAANVKQAKGSFDGPDRSYTIDANDQISAGSDYQSVVITYKNGAPVLVKDVASVVEDAENIQLAAWMNQVPAVIMNVQRQPGANVIEVVDRIKKLLPQIQNTMPSSVDVAILTDRTVTIRASVEDVELELILSVVLVVLVIYVFLRNWRATVIPAVAVPLSLVGTFAVMYLAGFSINNLTLMALTIATGFVVDDAIVMIENVARFLEMGDSPMEAALKGARQIGFTIISLTFSLIAVLIPLLFMGDVVGRLFREFAITLAVSILISAVVSLTLTPMMCSRFLIPEHEQKHGPTMEKVGRMFETIITKYDVLLTWVLRHEKETLAVAVGTLALTILLYVLVPKGFFPVQDTGIIQGITEAPQSVSFAEMARRQVALNGAILKHPDVESISSFIGVDGSNMTLNTGRILLNLKSRRRANSTKIIAEIQKQVADIPGIQLYMQSVQDLTIDARVSRTQYQFSMQTSDPDQLSQWVRKLVEHLRHSPAVADVGTDLQDSGLQAYVAIDRDTAGRLGISVAAVDNALYNAFGQRLISTIFTQTNQYRVVLEANQLDRGLESIRGLYVPSASGTQVPLTSIATITETTAPLATSHLGQFPAAVVSFNPGRGYSLGEAVEAIENAQREINVPSYIRTDFQGAASAFRASILNELLLLLAAIVTMYIVLGILYESFIHPVTILSTLPSAGIGALLGLLVSGTELGVVSIIGIVLLIGIVKKNAIMMIDFALDAERTQGKSPREAIHQACLLRFRPILMTTMAALLGALPLMLGQGVGSELRHPLGITMVGGLIVSQVLTLFTTPVIYLAFDRLSRRVAPQAGRVES